MIAELRINDPKNTCIPWWETVQWLQDRKSVEFKPGLNILWGPNGSGKSTVIKAIARMLHCEQGGVQAVTQKSLSELYAFSGKTMRDGAMPIHDGQPTLCFDSSHKVGLAGSSFDDDFFDKGINSQFATRTSAGEQTLHGLDSTLSVMIQKEFPAIDWMVSKHAANDVWVPRIEATEVVLKGTLTTKGTPTVLLDEPDRSISLIYQGNLWWNLAMKMSKDVQIIAASHSPFALLLPDANYIETVPGYLARCEKAIMDLATRTQKEP